MANSVFIVRVGLIAAKLAPFEIPCFRLVKRWPAKHPTLQFSIKSRPIDNQVNLLTFLSHDFTFLFHFSLLEFPFRFPIHVCTRSHVSSTPSTFISLSLIKIKRIVSRSTLVTNTEASSKQTRNGKKREIRERETRIITRCGNS